MKRSKIPFLYRSLFGLLFILMSSGVWGQDIVKYSFNDNLNHDPTPVPPVGTTLVFKGSNHALKTPVYNTQRLISTDEGDYLELTINTTGLSGMALSFDASFTGFGWGSWTVYTNNGSGTGNNWNNYTEFGNIVFGLFIGNSGSLTLPIPAGSENKPNVKFRIRSDFFSFGPTIRIDNLRISQTSANITVYTNTNTIIPHNSLASIPFNTDFGEAILIGDDTQSPYFRIRNVNGTGVLTISDFTISGLNSSDFTIEDISGMTVPIATSHTSSNYRQFRIRFTPTGDGLRRAIININSNGNQSPYSFEVVGQGASCSVFTTPYVINEFNPAITDPSLPSDVTSSNIITGTAQSNNIVRIYPNGPISLGSDNSSLFIRNSTNEFEFGGINGIDISGQKDVSIVFNVGGYWTSNNSNRGPNNNSFISLKVEHNNVFNEEIRLIGADNGNGYSYNIQNSSNGETYYETTYNGALKTITNRDEGWFWTTEYRYNTIRLNIPASKIAADGTLKFKIEGKNDNPNRFWIIDNVRIEVSNSVFTEYNGSSWSNGLPNATKKAVVLAGTYNPINNLEICECEVRSGATLNVGITSPIQSRNLTVRGKIIVEDGGNFNVRNNSNLIQIEDDAINTGSITVEKLFTFTNTPNPANDRKQYNFVISPTVGQNLKSIYPGTPTVIKYNEGNNYFYNHDGSYIPGKGFGIKEPSKTAVPGGTVIAQYKGTPFNGVLEFPLAYTTPDPEVEFGFNLTGNPYPSTIDIEELYEDHSTVIGTTFYFWDNRGNTQYSQQGSGYNGNNYAKYNAMSGTGTGTGQSAQNGSLPDRIPNQYVNVGTAFMVRALETANGQNIVFKNAYRSNQLGHSFFGKNGNEGPNDTVDPVETKDRYWLTLRTPGEMEFMNAVVYFDQGDYTFGMDDSESSGGSDEIFTLVDSLHLAIQGRPQFVDSDEVPLGIKAFHSGNHVISILKSEGVFAQGQKIYLVDKYLDAIHNLSEGGYNFETEAGEFLDRFRIVYKTGDEEEEEPVLTAASQVQIQKINKQIVISSQKDKLKEVEIFNFAGWSVYKDAQINALEVKIPMLQFGKGIVVIKVQTETGEVVSQKMIIK